MKIVGCDLHATQQTIAMVDTETGEFSGKILSRERNAVQAFCAVNNGGAIVLSWQQNSSDALMVHPRNAVKKTRGAAIYRAQLCWDSPAREHSRYPACVEVRCLQTVYSFLAIRFHRYLSHTELP